MPVTGRFLGVLRHELLQVGLSRLMLAVRVWGSKISGRQLGPLIGGRHVDLDRFQPGAGSLDVE